MADTVKTLTIKLNTTVSNVKKDGDGWIVTVSQDAKTQVIKAKLIIDATSDASIAGKMKIAFNPFNPGIDYHQTDAYRTGIATGEYPPAAHADKKKSETAYTQLPGSSIPLPAIVAPGTENL